ncbi:hypothetical protein B0O80DRAFT_460680 [Mortierella sp. GBAus27b]|nr:hypothetical protein B0O80DRAFT_460680 [Mortierella sp. GBAus27b]
MDDLQALAKAVTTASVIRLTMDGTQLKGPSLDIGNRSRRFDPIAQLTSNARMQSLRLTGFNSFFSRVSNPSLALTSNVREFSMDSYISSKDHSIDSFNDFLEHSPCLTSVELKFQKQYPITKTVADILDKLRKLESLKIDRGEFTCTINVSESRIQDMTFTVERLGELGLDDFRFIQQGELTHLAIQHAPRHEKRLRDIIRRSPRLDTLRIGCVEARCLAMIKLVASTRASLLQGRLSRLRTLELMEEKLVPFDDNAKFNGRTIIYTCLSFDEDAPTFDMKTWIRLRWGKLITVDEPVCEIVREYGWSIVHVRASISFSDQFAGYLDDGTSERGSRLETLEVYPFNLTDAGLEQLGRTIERSPQLMGLILFLPNMNLPGNVETTQALLSRHGKKLHGVSLYGKSPGQWLPQIASSFPTRNCFPVLRKIEILFSKRASIPSNCVSWIIAMVSAPPQDFDSSSWDDLVVEQQPSSDIHHGSGIRNIGWMNITKVCLENVVLGPEEWEMVIKAIDWSSLQQLSFASSNFAENQMKLLVDCVTGCSTEMMPLRSVSIWNSDVVMKTDSGALEAILAPLKEKLPSIDIRK